MVNIVSECIRVHPKNAEKIRKKLIEKNLLQTDLKISKNNDYIFLPIKSGFKNIKSYKVEKKEFEKQRYKPKSYKNIVSIPEYLKSLLPKSYDVVGNIILIKLSDELLDYKSEIGESLLNANKNIKTVCLIKPVSGELRIRKIKIIAGENCTITTHREYGLIFDVDLNRTYFSPRLSSERKLIADKVKNDEIIVDMFAGVAPFSITIAKYANPKMIYAVDKNEFAVKYAKQNIINNNVLDKIILLHNDAKNINVIVKKYVVKADRIIMNLPFSSYLFFTYALDIIADSCIIHYYDILKKEDIKRRLDELKNIADEKSITLKQYDIRFIKTYAPHEFYIGIDIMAKKNADVA